MSVHGCVGASVRRRVPSESGDVWTAVDDGSEIRLERRRVVVRHQAHLAAQLKLYLTHHARLNAELPRQRLVTCHRQRDDSQRVAVLFR